ncbi:RNA polymerase sigma factor RpoS [Clostridium saccharobutylicum]|uniref:sigma factor-like helix-turn-helix DNA-binding protein n=1 Tax=Clostridium saccharobutylicum TaxID=169679 RepID=UPI000983A9B4|nr:sigma factor-like helix-turn-helix DNA-binding protein [Clostridium saccharobutylicum]AQS09894.1 RNA polymerase sigma factor RpoS [Clostridium saccharobutylicum]MBC2437055.1 hypothetical protein [Clostridium saccharobutylicum]NSB89509.1 putative DNA-binding protein (UPF0251 family) [Clostridium saccharobutylicum]OOM12780.1 RNA polymerase sigma factor RpoS [Clostridium saccharobutylicum]
MKDYIKIEENVKKNEFISIELKELLRHEVEGTIDLEYLREIYTKDQTEFIRLYQELAFRGCTFITKMQSNLLQNIEITNDDNYIFVNDNNYFYKNINFNKYKLGDLVVKYKINDDRFFNFVPIEGFKAFNKEIDLEKLSEEFYTNGFLIKSIGELQALSSNINKTENNIDMDTNLEHNEKEEENILQKALPFKTIESYFSDSIFNSFREVCKEVGIVGIHEITLEVIDRYSNYPYVGAGKIQKIKDRLSEINLGQLWVETSKEININIDDITSIPISKLFHDTKHGLFINFCKIEGITTIGQLNNEVINKFSCYKGVGKKRVDDIRKILEEHIVLENEDLSYPIDQPLIIEEKWINILKDIELYKIAKILDLPWNLNNEIVLGNINGKTIEEILPDNENYKELIAVVKAINRQKTIEEILNESKLGLKENIVNAIKLRYENGYTLEQAGQKLNITRERVRQLVENGKNKIYNFANELNIDIAMKFSFYNKKFCWLEDFYDLCGEENLAYAKQFVKNEEILKVCEYLDIIYFADLQELNISIQEYISSLPKYFRFYDELDDITDRLDSLGIDDISIEKIEKLLELRGYKQQGDYYSKSRMSLMEIFETIFSEYLNEPLCLDEKGYEYLAKICLQKFDYILDSGIRAVDGRIRDVDTIISVDKKMLMHVDKVNIEDETITRVEEIIDNELKEKAIVSSQYLLEKYCDELKSIGISNKHILYSIVRYYLSEKYITGKGNTMEISKSIDDLKQSREKIIVELIYKNNGKIKKNDIISITEWPIFKLEDTISKAKEIIKIGNYLTIEEYIHLTDEVKDIIRDVVSIEMNCNNFLVTTKLYDDLVIIPQVYDFFEKNEIYKGEHLNSLIKYIVPNIKGNTFFMTKKNSNYKNFNEVIINKFSKGFTDQEIMETLNFYGFKIRTLASFINELVKTGGYIKVAIDKYVRKTIFNIDDEVINKLIEFIEEKFSDKEYLSLNTVTGFKRKLPNINYEWDIYLIESLLTMNGYRKVERTFYDQNTERLILVRENSNIKKFDELVYYILKNEYDGIMHEAKIYAYLSEIGIIYNNIKKADKKMPYDLYISEKFKIDEYGRVELL